MALTICDISSIYTKHTFMYMKLPIYLPSVTYSGIVCRTIIVYWRFPHTMWNEVYVTVGRSSVRPSVCPIDRQQQRRPAGLQLSALWTGDIDRYLRARCGHRAAGAGAQQQMQIPSCWEPTGAQHRCRESSVNLHSIYLTEICFVTTFHFAMLHPWNQLNVSATLAYLLRQY